MAHSILQSTDARHLLKADGVSPMAKADVRKADVDAWRGQIGRAVDRVRQLSGLNLQQFSNAIDRDDRQVKRWIEGKDRPQLDALFAVPMLREHIVVALAELLSGQGVEVETTVRIRRQA